MNGQTKSIEHEIDLFCINPEFDFTFDTELYSSLSCDDGDFDRMDDLTGNY